MVIILFLLWLDLKDEAKKSKNQKKIKEFDSFDYLIINLPSPRNPPSPQPPSIDPILNGPKINQIIKNIQRTLIFELNKFFDFFDFLFFFHGQTDRQTDIWTYRSSLPELENNHS